jgi:hypothetical protein
MRQGYVIQQLGLAVSGMATDANSLQSRLADAIQHNLIKLKSEDFPSTLRANFERVLKATKGVASADGEGGIVNRTREMSDSEAKELIETIYILFKRMMELPPGRTPRRRR